MLGTIPLALVLFEDDDTAAAAAAAATTDAGLLLLLLLLLLLFSLPLLRPLTLPAPISADAVTFLPAPPDFPLETVRPVFFVVVALAAPCGAFFLFFRLPRSAP